jgi:spore coat polysaccharide biosynthesis predicted glycosyltransferase SpsG
MAARRVLIRVDGTRDIGLGHVVRMRTLALAFRERGDPVTVATRQGTLGAKLMAEAGLAVRELPDSPAPDDLAEAAAALRPDLTVVDTLETTDAELAALRRGRLVVFDDWGAGLRLADAVVNAIVFHWGRYRREEARAKLFEGPAYVILPPDIAARAGRAPNIAPVARRLFLAIGGTDSRGLTPRMLDVLARLSGPLEIRVNLGPGSNDADAVRAAAAHSPHRTEILAGAPSLADEFIRADLALCGGGNTLYELAALGVPAAAVATEDHEAANIRYWSGVGSAVDLGSWSALDGDRVAETVAALSADPARRGALSAAGLKTVDGRGLERCLAVLDGLAA